MGKPQAVAVAHVAEVLRVPTEDDHKYTRGTVTVATGSETYPGAGVLSVLGAMSAGASLVRFISSPTPTRLVLTRAPEVLLASGKSRATVVGSGIDTETEAQVRRVAAQTAADGIPLVVDAGAILLWKELSQQTLSSAVLTPHVGEAAELWLSMESDAPLQFTTAGEAVAHIREDPTRAARELSHLTGQIVVLKGATTIIAQPQGATYSVDAPGAWAATAGSGDVLAGVIGTAVAQNPNTTLAAAVGVKLHAVAAGLASGTCDALGQTTGQVGGPIVATNIAEALPQVVRAMLEASV